MADNVRWLLGCLAMFGAPDTTVILITAVPRAQLSGDDLSAFWQLSDALWDVAAEYAPRASFWTWSGCWRPNGRSRAAGAAGCTATA